MQLIINVHAIKIEYILYVEHVYHTIYLHAMTIYYKHTDV
jgi:hypothetical protein